MVGPPEGLTVAYTVHAAKIPESAQSLTPAERRLRGVQYVNACNDKPWVPLPDSVAVVSASACENCKIVVSYQPRSKP